MPRRIAGRMLVARAWRPATLAAMAGGILYRRRNALLGLSDRDHLEAAAAWLARAQDSQKDGGVSGRYHLATGWSSSYPETTGYIVPTMLALEADAGLPGFRARAERCIEFLLGVQLDSGAFPGMEIAENRDQPSIFNSAQILNGLTAWHRATGDDAVLHSARRAADWLVEAQDPDGAWRQHLYGGGKTYTYMAHAGCWIAEFGAYLNDPRYLDAARRHLAWVLTHVDAETGWIDDCGFDDGSGERVAVTHTIAYTIWGVLMMSRILGDERGLEVARRAAHAVARRLEISKWLPGRLDARWKPAADYACLTGNAQMALIWFDLHRLDRDPALVNAALRAIDLVKAAQVMRSSNPGLLGGIAGSNPIWGQYVANALPNWAAKFFLDALMAKEHTLRELAPLPYGARGAPSTVTAGVPVALASPAGANTESARPRVVLLSDEFGPKVEQFTNAWSTWGFRPDAVVVRRAWHPPVPYRLRAYIREYGIRNLARRLIRAKPQTIKERPRQGTIPTSGVPVSAFCAERGIPTVVVAGFNDPGDLERIRSLNADLFVYAGCGILRPQLLALARLGTVNAHMGLLPQMRGMNVAEWSEFIGAPVGCTIHMVDAGIDTGAILLFQPVDVSGAPDIDALRQRVDVAQIDALGRVVQWVVDHGSLPPSYVQQADEGRQYFSMHQALRDVLEAKLTN
jgi:folate-dependent phosphoribosylglycinamide formyltransferase PurN